MTSRWSEASSRTTGPSYAQRFADLAAHGVDVHGEATFCAGLVPPGSRVLDAGCGTGRVAVRLAELGFDCVGIDSDPSMLDVARATGAPVRWILADLAGPIEPGLTGAPFDLVVAAGNVVPLLAAGTEAGVVAALADRLVGGGVLVTGFGLDPDHLPLPEAPVGLADYDRWCGEAGLEPIARFATWDGEPYAGGGYAVSVHRRRCISEPVSISESAGRRH